MCGQRREIEGADTHGKMIEVPSGLGLRCRTGRHQIDHRGTGAQLHELGLFEPALDVTAQHLSVKPDRAIEIGDPKHQMIETRDTDRSGLRCLCPFQVRCVRHFRLRSVAASILQRFGRGRQADYCCCDAFGCDAALRGCWLRQARLSAGSTTPSWLVSIRSNCAAARPAARSSARWIYCSRVRPPVRDGAGLAVDAVD